MKVSRQTVLDFKNTFATESGLRVLEKLKFLCRGHVNLDLFDPRSERQTDYNLGMNRVYRYIASMIECDLSQSENEDCILDDTGEKL